MTQARAAAHPAIAPVAEAGHAVRFRVAALLLVGAWLGFHLWYVAAGWLDLAPEEAQYWEWSRHLDWSYYSKGPMVAYLIALSTRLGGHSELFVRLPAVVLSAAACLLAYALTCRLFGSERTAVVALLAYAACPLFAAGGTLMTTDVPLACYWMLAIYALARAVDPSERRAWRWWAWCGIAVGLGLLSKFTMAFFVVGAGAYLALAPARRRWLRSPAPYAALLIGVVVFSPVIVWNVTHDFVTVRHVAGLAGLQPGLASDRRPLAWFAELIGGQLGVVSPLLFVAAVAAAGRSAWRGVRDGGDTHLLLACFSVPVLLFFALWSLTERIEANWPAPAYGTALIAAAAWWDERYQGAAPPARRRLRRWLVLGLVPGFAISFLAHFSALLPAAGIELPARIDPTDRLRGWRALGERVGRILAQAGQPAPFLVAPSYQLAAELSFYTPGHPPAYEIDLGRRMSQYDLWGGLEQRRGENGVFVTNGEWPAAALAPFCEQPRQLDVLRIRRGAQPIETFSIYACDGFTGTPARTAPPSY